MGIFDWLFGEKSNVTIADDAIWLTQRAKFSGIAAEVRRLLNAQDRPLAILLVAHFPDCLNRLQEIAEDQDLRGLVQFAASGNLKSAIVPQTVLDESQRI